MNSVVIDTNVILDVLFMRDDFYDDSNKIIKLCEDHKLNGYITTSVLMDIRYFVYKFTRDKHITNKAINELIKIFKVVEIKEKDITKASSDDVKDFEDSVIENCAIRNKFDYIITRNTKHFENKKIIVISPSNYLK